MDGDGGGGDGEGLEEGVANFGPGDLVGAMRSLERTIHTHCVLLNRRLRGGRDKSCPNSATQRDRRPSLQCPRPLKGAVRGDKIHGPESGGGGVNQFCPTDSSTFHNNTQVDHDPEKKVTVYIRVVFLKLGEIDTLKENFAADAFIQARWREPSFDGKSDTNIDEVDWERYWNPKIYVENNLGEPKENIWHTLAFNVRGEATVYERRRIKGCFLENLELDEFPFDTQDLTLTVTSERSEAELELDEDHSEISSINIQSFVDEQEWRLHSHVETWKRVTTRIYQNSKYKHPALSTSCRASRRPGFYVWNIFLVMLFICSLAFSTFTVDLDLPQNRLQLSFILLLTTITFKFVVSQTLPRISYLTYLDKYILTSMGILCTVCMWHSIVPLLKYDMYLASVADRCALVILGSAYFMFHVIFFLYIYFVALKKRWTYNEKDREHKERMKLLQKMEDTKIDNKMGKVEPI